MLSEHTSKIRKKFDFFDIKKNNISFLKKIKDINYLIISHGINVNLDETKKLQKVILCEFFEN